MIIRDDSAKAGDPYKQKKAQNKGEELKIDLGRDLSDEEAKIFAKLQEGLTL